VCVKRQQVADRDGALCWHNRTAGSDGRLGELRNHPADGVVKRELAFLDERQDRRTGDGFRLRRDTEDGVGRHPPPGFLVAPPDSALVHGLSVAQHEGDDARDPVVIDVLLQRAVDASDAFGREPGFRRDCRAGRWVLRRALRRQHGGSYDDRCGDKPGDEIFHCPYTPRVFYERLLGFKVRSHEKGETLRRFTRRGHGCGSAFFIGSTTVVC
jgi:hypothetical protein